VPALGGLGRSLPDVVRWAGRITAAGAGDAGALHAINREPLHLMLLDSPLRLRHDAWPLYG